MQTFNLNIDFNQLKHQKLVLIDMVHDWARSNLVHKNVGAEMVDGIFNLLDAIQDQAVEKGYRTEEEVFDLSQD